MGRKLLLFGGMNPERRVVSKVLPLLPGAETVEWIPPLPNETIPAYAARISDLGDFSGYDVGGVSFGGFVAQEIAPMIGAKRCFVISSAVTRNQLPALWRAIGVMPSAAQQLAIHLNRRNRGPQAAWYKWVNSAVLRWRPEQTRSYEITQIHGDKDPLFPRSHPKSDHVVSGAGHLLALTHAEELAEAISSSR